MIIIPTRFSEILQNDLSLHAGVNSTLTAFTPWLVDGGMPFFPGFTDHSIKHINEVLETASSLITDEAYKLLVPGDIAVLCISILLHDCGMHLTADSFRKLIKNEQAPIITEFYDKPWSELWINFLSEAKRFGQDKLIAIFGDKNPIEVHKIDYNNLTERDHLLIGEFVRRHHCRLAHEIALSGVPGPLDTKLQIIGLKEELKDLSGLVARSHGMSIRKTFEYLKDKYGLITEQYNIKTPYIMGILRIADYIQVQSERAIQTMLTVKELRSPISRQEWKNHFAVGNIAQSHEDPEALFVSAKPKDVYTFLKLKSLFGDIQKELDETWATIGEVYGRMGNLAKLGLTIRRIISNIDSVESFSKTVKYIPYKAGFDTSGPDLLKLLVGPLYNYDISVGIRELIQNSVDACKERADLDTLNASEYLVTVTGEEYDGTTGAITIRDNGVGMTLDTVTNFFLKAGASFRNSDMWKSQHLNDSGESRVLRGGRFGVGALAPFLLGDEIEVTTRHFRNPENQSINFNAKIDDSVIQLKRCSAEIGTSIKISVSSKEIFSTLRPTWFDYPLDNNETIDLEYWEEMDWYVGAMPSVEFYWSGFDRDLDFPNDSASKINAKFSQPNIIDHSTWNKLPNPLTYKDIFWTYHLNKTTLQNSGETSFQAIDTSTEVFLNDIRVERNSQYSSRHYFLDLDMEFDFDSNHFYGHNFNIIRPSLSIQDPAGYCPINLQRDAISFQKMGIDILLAEAIINVYLDNFINEAKNKNFDLKSIHSLIKKYHRHDGLNFQGIYSPFFITREGIFLSSEFALLEHGITEIFFIENSEDSPLKSVPISELLLHNEAICLSTKPHGTQNYLACIRALFSIEIRDNYYTRTVDFISTSPQFSSYLTTKESWNYISSKGKIKNDILKGIYTEYISETHSLSYKGNSSNILSLRTRILELHTMLGDNINIGHWSICEIKKSQEKKSILMDIWMQKIKNTLLKF